MAITSFNRWQTIPLEIPSGPRTFRFSLGISIHVNNRVDTKQDPPPPLPPVKVCLAGFGVEFIRPGVTGPVLNESVSNNP